MAAKRLLLRLFVIAGSLALLGCCLGSALFAADEPPPPPALEWNVYLDHWQVLGPFPKLQPTQNSGELERELVPDEAELRPDKPVTVDGKNFAWHAWPGRMVDFIQALDLKPADAQYALAYAYNEFTSDAERKVILAIGHDDCVRVWLNGEQIHRNEAWVSSELDQARIEVTLQKGTNRLLAKVCNGYGGWEFAARVLPIDLDQPLVSMSATGSSSGNMARLPLLDVEFLDANGNVSQTLHASGGRAGGSGARYTIYAKAPDPEPTKIRIHFDEPGFLPFDKTFNWTQAKNGSIWISLSAKDRIRGRVVDEKSLKPVAGAEFFAGETPVSKKSNAEGRFEFTMRDPLADIVEVRAAGYEPLQTRVEHGGEWIVKVAPGGHTFRGRILSEDGKPIANARIAMYLDRRNVTLQSDAEGRFEISGMSKNRDYIYPTVSHPDYVAKDGFNQPLEADGLTEVEWRLETGCVVAGRVTAKGDGNPLAGIQIVSGTDRFGSNAVNPQAITDDEGRFRLTGIQAGSALVHAFSREYVPASLSVNVAKDSTASADFELAKGKAISGRVVDPDGRPVVGVTLAIDTINGSRMLDRRIQTDSNGEFRYENMPDTPVKIDMFKRGWVSKRDFESTGGQHSELTMYPVVEHEALIRASDTGKPPQGLTSQVGYQWQGRDEISWQEEDYSGNTSYDPSTGVLRINVDEPSSSKLFFRVRAPGYRDHVLTNPEIGTPAQTWNITLEKVATSGGKVVDADTGKPIAGVLVALVSKEDRLSLDHYHFSDKLRGLEQFTGIKATTADDGTFELSQPTSDQATDLVLFRENQSFHYIPNAREVLADGGAVLPLPAGGTVEGRIMVAGEPIADAPVHLAWKCQSDPDNAWQLPFGFGGQSRTDAQGRYRYSGLGPGQYQVNRIRNWDYPSGRGSMSAYLTGSDVLVLPGQTVTHDFIVPPGHKLSGEVVDAEGEPVANCQVDVMRVSAQNERVDMAFTQADGRFEVPHLQPGSYTLRVQQYVPSEWGGFDSNGGHGTGTVKVVDGDVTTSIKITPRPGSRAPTAAPGATATLSFVAATPTSPNTIVGSVPPDFSGKLFGTDKSFNLSDHFGKVVAIDFWATWCGPCMQVMPEMKQLYEKYKESDDVVFVTVSLDQDPEALKTVLEEQGLEFPVIYESREASQAIASGFGVTGIPASFVIGRDGRFASERVHGSQLTAALEQAIESPQTPRFGAGVNPARLTVKLSLDDGASGVPGAAITFKAFDDIGMPVGEETIRSPGQSKQLTWLYAPFENGGKIDVRVEAEGLESQQKTVESPGEKAEVTFEFQSPRAIRGRIAVAADEDDGKEQPVVGVKVVAHSTTGVQRASTTDADGKFEIRVMPGSYIVIPTGNDDFAPIAANREQLEVSADEDPVPLEIPACKTVTVTGTVMDEEDQPVEGANVRTTVSEKVVKTDAEGRFELPGVPSKGQVHLYALKRPKSAVVMLENCDGTEPQTLVLGTLPGRGAGRLSKGMKMPKLPLVTLADGEPVDWKPTSQRDTLILFTPLWHPATRDFVTRGKAWADEHDADLVTVSTDWSLDQARREAELLAVLLPTRDAVLYAGPGGLELAKEWALAGKPQAVLISAGKIAAAPLAGQLP